MALLTIERIEDAGPDRKARRLFFAADAEPRVTSAAVVRALCVVEGDTLDTDAIESLEPDMARERALTYLGYRERSSHDLRQRLMHDGYPKSLAHAITSRFAELGLVDDVRFARMYVRTRLTAGYGTRRILHELTTHGITDAIARSAIEDIEGDPLDAARRALNGKVPVDQAGRQRLVRKLIARGFSLNIALQATDGVDDDTDH